MKDKKKIAYLAYELGIRSVYQVNPTKCKDYGIYSDTNLDRLSDQDLMKLLTKLLD